MADYQLGVAEDLNIICPICLASDRRAIKDCYSLSLLVALKLHLTALQAVSPAGEVCTISTPAPRTLLEPST